MHYKAPIALHDITQASIDLRGVKPTPQSVQPGDAPMRAVPVVIQIRCNGETFTLHPTGMTLLAHVWANYDPEKLTTFAEVIPQNIVPVGPEQQSRLVLHATIPKDYVLVKRSELAIVNSRSAPLVIVDEIVQPEHSEPTSEELAVSATRKANGLSGSVDPDVIRLDVDAYNRVAKSLHSKPAIPDAYGKE